MGEGGPQVIHVGYTPANVEQVYFPQVEVTGDIDAEPGAIAEGAWAPLALGLRSLSSVRAGVWMRIAERHR